MKDQESYMFISVTSARIEQQSIPTVFHRRSYGQFKDKGQPWERKLHRTN